MNNTLNWIQNHLLIIISTASAIISWILVKKPFQKKQLEEKDVNINLNVSDTFTKNFNLQQAMYLDLENKIEKLRNDIQALELQIHELLIEIDLKNQYIEDLEEEINNIKK